jgi:hypothetical protein
MEPVQSILNLPIFESPNNMESAEEPMELTDEEYDYDSEEEVANQKFDEYSKSDKSEEREILVCIMSIINNYTPTLVSANPSEPLSSFQTRICALQGSLYELRANNEEHQLCPEKTLKENGIRDGSTLKEKMPIEITVQIAQLGEKKIELNRIEDVKAIMLEDNPWLAYLPFVMLRYENNEHEPMKAITAADIQPGDVIVFQELDLFLASYTRPTTSDGLLRCAVLLRDGPGQIKDPHSDNELLDVTSAVLAGEVAVPAGSPTLAISLRPEQILFGANLTLLVRGEDGVPVENRLPSSGFDAADLLSFCPVAPLAARQLLSVVVADHRRGEELLSFLVRVI